MKAMEHKENNMIFRLSSLKYVSVLLFKRKSIMNWRSVYT